MSKIRDLEDLKEKIKRRKEVLKRNRLSNFDSDDLRQVLLDLYNEDPNVILSESEVPVQSESNYISYRATLAILREHNNEEDIIYNNSFISEKKY